METFSRGLDGRCYVHVQLWEHLRAKTFAALSDHTGRKKAMTSAADIAERGAMIREAFLRSLGGLPDSSSPLNPLVVGAIQGERYTIERIIFESQPHVYVTSLLYLPTACQGQVPGVLFVSGHHREAKSHPEYQRVCHDLVTSGFAVLAIDPTGQGERVTHLDPETGKDPVGWGTSEHSYQGVQCILTGTSIARYFLHDALRAVDYLQSRPEVDAHRIGVTGNSGGGTQTTLLCMSGDPRIKAAAPCTYVTSREHYYLTGQAQDAEQIQFGMTSNGINFDDMFLPFAPRPLLIGAVESDFFSPEGTALTYDRLRRWYRLAGSEDHVACVNAPGNHKYCKELREAVVRWFSRHLLGVESTFTSQDDEGIATLDQESLRCTSKGQAGADFGDVQSPYHLNLKRIPVRNLTTLDALRENVIHALRIGGRLKTPCDLFPRTTRTQVEGELLARSVHFLSEPDMMVSGCLIHNASDTPTQVVVILTERGTKEINEAKPLWGCEVTAGRAAFVFDVRGKGSIEADAINGYGTEYPETFFNTDNWLSFCAYCVGECLLGMRVFDVLRAFTYLRSAGFSQVAIHAKGLGPALWGYLAAALDSGVTVTQVEELLESFEAIVRTQLYRKDFTPALFIPDVLRHFDLPDLKRLFYGRQLLVKQADTAIARNRVSINDAGDPPGKPEV